MPVLVTRQTEQREGEPPLPEAWKPLRYHPIQYAYWHSPRRFKAVAAGRGSGKTELARRKQIRKLGLSVPGCRRPMHFYSLPTRDQAKRVAWDELKALIPSGWIRTISETDLSIKTVFGSELHLVGMDRPERIEGNQWVSGVMDESSDTAPKAFALSVRPALSHYQGTCDRIGVPKRQGIGAAEFRAFFFRGQQNDEQIESFTWPSSDILPPEEIKAAKSLLDPVDYAEQYDANWQNASGQIFYAFTRKLEPEGNLSFACVYQPQLTIAVMQDFNVDPMAWVLGHLINGKLYVFKEIWLRNSNTQSALSYLHSLFPNHRAGWYFFGDASSRARKTSASATDYILIANDARFNPKHIQFPASNPPIKDRFAATNAALMNALGDIRVLIHPDCVHLCDDLEHRAYKPGTMEPADTGDIGHISDALGYGVVQLFPLAIDIGSGQAQIYVTGDGNNG